MPEVRGELVHNVRQQTSQDKSYIEPAFRLGSRSFPRRPTAPEARFSPYRNRVERRKPKLRKPSGSTHHALVPL